MSDQCEQFEKNSLEQTELSGIKNFLSEKGPFGETLLQRLEKLQGLASIPAIEPTYAMVPSNALSFLNGTDRVVVVTVGNRELEKVVCLYFDETPVTRSSDTAWGKLSNGDEASKNMGNVGLAIRGNEDGASPIYRSGGRVPQLLDLQVYSANVENFNRVVERMFASIERGEASQDGRVLSEPTEDLKY